ncbi:hypothetical protein [Streptomyces tendae]|uniref:hypothetical protein n=1 Tax=Streptomyces tendae TaxID=1932 RepID=UPI003714CE03
MSSSHEVTWERQTIDVTSDEPWKRIEPTGTTELTCTCGWGKLVPDADVQQASADHRAHPID